MKSDSRPICEPFHGSDMTTNTTRTVCVVDDDDAVRDSLQALLESTGFTVATYPGAQPFLDAYRPETIRCALIDVRMPEVDGMQLLDIISARPNLPPVVIITGHGEVELAVRAMKKGAFDFIEKPFEPDALIERVGAAVRWGESRLAEEDRKREARRKLDELTPREKDVLESLIAGFSNKAIARRLELSPRTVEVHRARIMDKTGAESFSHLVRLALRAGLEPETEAIAGEETGEE